MGSLEPAQGQPSIPTRYYPLHLNAGPVPIDFLLRNQYLYHQAPPSSIQFQQVPGINVPVESWRRMEDNFRNIGRSVSYLTADIYVLSKRVNELQQELFTLRSTTPTTATEGGNEMKGDKSKSCMNIGQSEANTYTHHEHHAEAEILLNLKHTFVPSQRTMPNSGGNELASTEVLTSGQQAKALRRHTAKEKAGNRFHCDICKRTFKFPSRLRQHLVYHSEESPFMCEVAGCGKRYKVKSQLSRHSYVHKEKLQCEYCCSKLSTPQSLRWHVKTVHKMYNKKSTM